MTHDNHGDGGREERNEACKTGATWGAGIGIGAGALAGGTLGIFGGPGGMAVGAVQVAAVGGGGGAALGCLVGRGLVGLGDDIMSEINDIKQQYSESQHKEQRESLGHNQPNEFIINRSGNGRY